MIREKRTYIKPMMMSEQFAADEYIAACWVGKCNISGDVCIDRNDNDVFEPRIDRYLYTNTRCGEEFIFRDISDDIDLAEELLNAFVVEKKVGYFNKPDYGLKVTPVYYWPEHNDKHVATAKSIRRHSDPNHS